MINNNIDCMLWLAVYADGILPVASSTVIELFECAKMEFHLEIAQGSFGPSERSRIQQGETWLTERLAEQSRARPPDVPHVAVMGDTESALLWSLESCANRHFQHSSSGDPRLVMSISFSLAKSGSSVWNFVRTAARTCMRDPRIWYGFVNPAPREHIGHTSYYSGGWYEGARTWERYLENCYWMDHALRDRDRARGVFWGNIFGRGFADKLRKEGYYEGVEWLRNDSFTPLTLEDKQTGAMTVLLDDDPVRFAMKRDDGLELGSFSRSVKTGAMLRNVMSRARLL